MKVRHSLLCLEGGWHSAPEAEFAPSPQCAFVFGPREKIGDPRVLQELRRVYPDTRLLIGSSCGEIAGPVISDGLIAVTALSLEHTTVRGAVVAIEHREDSAAAGRELARQLTAPDLAHVFVVSDGRMVNGSQLARGLNESLPSSTTVTGGLAGDGTQFEQTLVGLDDSPTSNRIAAIGFYSRRLRVGFGSSGGWIPFGPERTVTRAHDHELFELDGHPALELYKKYLGDAAAGLPASALRFPLWVRPPDGGGGVVRTPHRIDEAAGSMDFAGDISERARVRMLHASYEDLIDGAARAAEDAMQDIRQPELALCVSCVARRVVLGSRTEEELESVHDVIGVHTPLCGFYSYGELAPINGRPECHFHNQTMTITTFREEVA